MAMLYIYIEERKKNRKEIRMFKRKNRRTNKRRKIQNKKKKINKFQSKFIKLTHLSMPIQMKSKKHSKKGVQFDNI
jgi:hypothetical protein